MKKLAAVLLGCTLAFTFTAFGQVKDADQKWLAAVEKMVTQGEKKVTTPKEERVKLLKDWSDKKGYTVKVTKTDSGYTVEVNKARSSAVAKN